MMLTEQKVDQKSKKASPFFPLCSFSLFPELPFVEPNMEAVSNTNINAKQR
jgi:hypothetical protein